MEALFVALGIMVLTLLALLLWFVPHLLQQQASRVAGETSQLREMLLDLLNEQEAVTLRQTQLGGSLTQLREQIESIAKSGVRTPGNSPAVSSQELQQLEDRLVELQSQMHHWADQRAQSPARFSQQDNESWAYLLSLLSAIQGRVGELSQDRVSAQAGVQAGVLLEELEQEMRNLRGISEDIEKLQWRLRRSLNERESTVGGLRTYTSS
jgi:hypothetical protein